MPCSSARRAARQRSRRPSAGRARPAPPTTAARARAARAASSSPARIRSSRSPSWTAASHSHGTGSDSWTTTTSAATRSRSSRYLSIGNLCPSGSGMRQRSWPRPPSHQSMTRPLNGQDASHGDLRRHRSRRHQDPGGGRGRGPDHDGPRRQARPDAAQGRPEGDRGARWSTCSSESLEEAGRRDVCDLERRRRRLAGQRRRREGHRHRRHEPVRLGGHVQPAQGAGEGARRARSRSATTSTSPTDAEFEIGAAKAVPVAARRLLGHRRRRRADPRRQAVGRPRDRRARSATWSSASTAPSCPCGRRGCMEAYAGRGAMEARARRRVEQGEKTRAVQDHGGARPRPALQRHLGARAGPRRPDGASSCSRRRSRRSAPASPRRSTCSTPRRS